jgi:hypothetical protein
MCLDIDMSNNLIVLWNCNKNLNQIFHFPISYDLIQNTSCSIHSSINLDNNDPKKCFNIDKESGYIMLENCDDALSQKIKFYKIF